MRILVIGGGSGGHVTPILPVVDQLKALRPNARIDFVGQRGDHASLSIKDYKNIDEHHYIFAGKWRRYSNQSFAQKILDVHTIFLNTRDVVYLFIGCFQSLFLLLRIKPEIIFIKGGYVGVPVGLAAALLRVPFITHDSDTLPGIANRIISRWAQKNAVGAQPENYTYPKEKIIHTGVPIRPIPAITNLEKETLRTNLGLDVALPVVLVTGGGNGAESINAASVAIASEVTKKAHIIHIAGINKESAVRASLEAKGINDSRYTVLGYTDAFISYIQVADIVVTRAGATTIAELATAKKAALIVPAPQLADQIKNARMLSANGLRVLDDVSLSEDPTLLQHEIMTILDNAPERQALERSIAALSMPDAAKMLAAELLLAAKEQHA